MLSQTEGLIFVFCSSRYELAQQLQPQSAEDPLGGGAVAHEMQVEIEGDSLQQPAATSAEQQSMLGLGQAEVVNGGQQVTLEAPLTDQPLVQGEGEHLLDFFFFQNVLYATSVGSKGLFTLTHSLKAYLTCRRCRNQGPSSHIKSYLL